MTDDKQAKIDAIKARLAKVKEGGGDAAPKAAAKSADGGGDAPAADDGGDVKARIAALKAKMDAGKGAEKKAAAKKPAAKKKPSAANVYPMQPVNKTIFGDERLHSDRTVVNWFILSSLLLVVTILLMWRRDAVRDWKGVQEAFRQNEIARLTLAQADAEAAIDPEALATVDAGLAAVEAELAGQADTLNTLGDEALVLEGEFYAADQRYKIAKSELDELRYNYEEERLLHGEDAELMAEADEALEAQTAKVDELTQAANSANQAMLAKKKAIQKIEEQQTELTRQRDALREDLVRTEKSLATIGPGIFNDFIRNAPMADMLAPTYKVEKVVLDKLRDNYNFQYVGKVDMCTTCHVGIDNPFYIDHDPLNEKGGDGPLAGKGERVLNAHPRLDLFLTDSSPHPIGEFGCTTCHQGNGQRVEFPRTFHTPAPTFHEGQMIETAEEKEARWIEDWGYEPDRHYWDWPMTPSDKLYSSCFQCHDSTDRIPGVPEYNESRALVEDLGCYGCHKIQGFEHLRKPGPDLTNLQAKTTPEFIQKWLMDPQGFRPSTRMPHFWNQSNSGAHAEDTISPDAEWDNNSDRWVGDWRARNEVEARAISAYLLHQSQEQLDAGSYSMEAPPAGEGDIAAGKATFESRGCLGCHSMEGEGWTENDHGPELSAIGSKVNSTWLYNWIRDPKAYYHTSVMPDLRLTDAEAWNITAWLMDQRSEEWEQTAPPAADAQILDDIAVTHLASIAGDNYARDEVARMRADGESVEVFVGQKLFERFGCSGCHLVPGHYDDVGIGTELTYESLKEITKFDFGHEAAHTNPEAIGHSRRAWYERKLEDPRAYDRLPVIGKVDGEYVIEKYEQKVKAPNDKLKMPNFYLDDAENDLVVQFLLGLRADGIDPTMKVQLDGDAALVEEGSRLITKYNCIGCHRMGQLPQYMLVEKGEDFDDALEGLEEVIDEAMEYGAWTAQPVVVNGQELFAAHAWLEDEFYDAELEEDYDLYEFFEDDPENREIPGEFLVYGEGEGGMGRYIDDSAMRPPVLRGQGAKSNPDWLFDFLLDPYIVRTHVNVRMPTFGLSEHESLALVRWFAAQADQAWPFEPVSGLEKTVDEELYRRGEDLFNTYQCNSCHPSGDVLPESDPGNWGPDLALTQHRLKTDWVHDWLLDPQVITPGTRMPNFFGEFSEGEYDAQYDESWRNGDSQSQIEALQHYLEHLGKLEPAEENQQG
ncbi:MAG: hypothetical protein DHS20C15_33940 [Planctomycetota bacterium]|nr:MAG: hypothetical protein DHS20C15_33940 [Planctomycetota bacterium]